MKLTERDLHYVISEATRRIVNEWQMSGRVSYDGNHMVGGSWGSEKVSGFYIIDEYKLLEAVPEELYSEEIQDIISTLDGKLSLKWRGTYGYDESVGISYPTLTLNAVDASSAFKVIEKMEIAPETKNILIQAVQDVADDLTEDDIDYESDEY